MQHYYQLLQVSEGASTAEIEDAYQQQRMRYNPERVVALDAELHGLAKQRLAEIEQAYATLADPGRRAAYDVALRAHDVQPVGRVARTGITRREILMSAAGALVGLALIAVVWVLAVGGLAEVVWVLAGRTAAPELPPVGEVNRPAPDFALPGLNGGTVSLSDYRGKVVLINFWGTWCEPCKEETPALQAAYQELNGRGLEIIGVNLYSQETEGDQAVRDFISPYGVTYPIALDTNGDIARAFQISPIPVSYFVDPSGNIRFVKVGTLKAAEVRALFEHLQPRASVQP